MSADTSDLTKVDSAIGGVEDGPTKEVKETKRRTTSSAPGVMNLAELGEHRQTPILTISPNILNREGRNQDFRRSRNAKDRMVWS